MRQQRTYNQTTKPRSLKAARFCWQGKKVLNSRPTVLETVALPTELFPYKKGSRFGLPFLWWAFRDSNPRPTGYEPVALTN